MTLFGFSGYVSLSSFFARITRIVVIREVLNRPFARYVSLLLREFNHLRLSILPDSFTASLGT